MVLAGGHSILIRTPSIKFLGPLGSVENQLGYILNLSKLVMWLIGVVAEF